MNENDTDIFMTSLLEKYACRPTALESMCYVEFGRSYKPHRTQACNNNGDDSQNEDSDTEQSAKIIKLQNDLGYMRKRTKKICPRFHNVSRKADSEVYFHRLLICYLPWRSEEELKSHATYEAKFNSVKDEIKETIYENEPYLKDVEDALETMPDDENVGEIWNHLIPQAQDDEEIVPNRDYELLNPGNLDPHQLVNMEPDSTSTHQQTAITLQLQIRPDEEYYPLIRSLNRMQRQIHEYIFTWCMQTRLAHLLNSPTPAPFHIFLSGGGGVGKSHTVHTIYQSTVRILRLAGQNPDNPTILLTASTGKAAVNIDGITLHKAFHIKVAKYGEPNHYQKASSKDLHDMRLKYSNLKILVIDEISMVSAALLRKVHLTLQDIFENEEPFGSVSVLAVGDLLQLPPVAAQPVYSNISKQSAGYQSLVCSLWQKHFLLHELVEIMRQREDPEFASLLSRLRIGKHNSADFAELKALENNNSLPDDCLSIFCLNRQADEYNELQLKKLKSKIYTIVAQDSKRDRETGRVPVTIPESNAHDKESLPREIQFAVNAQYLHLKNTDLGDGLVNGATGIITHIDIDEKEPLKGTIYVKFYNPNIGRVAHKSSKYPGSVPIRATTIPFNPFKNQSVTIERTQYPGTLGWGLTVHRAQGSTYEKMIGHIKLPKDSGFRYQRGQIYTMLSRVKSRKGLKIIGFNPDSIKVNTDSLKEMERLQKHCTFSHQSPISTLPEHYTIAVGHLNVRSLALHYQDRELHLENSHVDVLCLTETHVNSYDQYTLPGFASFSAPCKHGCAIYTTRPIEHHFSYSTNIESTGVIIDSKLIACVYVPPKTSWAVIQNFFTEILTECTSVIAQQYNCNTITFMGDFNTGSDSLLQKLIDLFNQFGLQQYISTPTHRSGGILDLIFTNHGNTKVTTQPLYFTDHHFVAARFYPN
jgi:hypothetical protein